MSNVCDKKKKNKSVLFSLFFILFQWNSFNEQKKRRRKTSQTDLPGKPIKKRTNIFLYFFCPLILYVSFNINYIIFLFYLNTFVVSPVFFLDFLYWFNKLHVFCGGGAMLSNVFWLNLMLQNGHFTCAYTEQCGSYICNINKCEAQTFQMRCERKSFSFVDWKRVYISIEFICSCSIFLFFYFFPPFVCLSTESSQSSSSSEWIHSFIHSFMCVRMCLKKISLILLGNAITKWSSVSYGKWAKAIMCSHIFSSSRI